MALADIAVYQLPYPGSAPGALSWSARAASDVGRFGLDMSALVASTGDALVGGAEAVTFPSDLVASAASVTGSIASVLLSGGTPNVHVVTFSLEFASGASRQVSVAIVTRAGDASSPGETGGVSPDASTTSVSTTDAAPTTMVLYRPLAASGASISVRGVLTARNTATGDTISWDLGATVKLAGTSGANVSWLQAVPFSADAAMEACSVAFEATAATINLVLTGIAARPIVWTASDLSFGAA